MNLLRTSTLFLVVFFFLLPFGLLETRAQSVAEPGFVPMFNGTDFSGWVRTNTPESTWTFQDGLLICSGKPIGEIRTEKMYQNFIMELEWRHMVPGGNAGIFLFADDITAKGVPFHRGIEVQVLENSYGNTRGYTTHGDIFPIHGATMVPVNGRGGARAFPTENRSRPSPEWNHYRITAIDGNVTLAVNGAVVTEGRECSPRKGYICLESEGGVVHYRNVKIKVLPDSPVLPEQIAVGNRGYVSIYSGLDLSGWQTPNSETQSWVSQDWVLAYNAEAPDSRPLRHKQTLENCDFIIDFRLKQQESRVALQWVDAESGSMINGLELNLGRDGVDVPIGQWHRLEGTLVGNTLQWTLNGEDVAGEGVNPARQLEGVPTKRSLQLAPTGPVDFANLYLRQNL